jgi:hypothetical protein
VYPCTIAAAAVRADESQGRGEGGDGGEGGDEDDCAGVHYRQTIGDGDGDGDLDGPPLDSERQNAGKQPMSSGGGSESRGRGAVTAFIKAFDWARTTDQSPVGRCGETPNLEPFNPVT